MLLLLLSSKKAPRRRLGQKEPSQRRYLWRAFAVLLRHRTVRLRVANGASVSDRKPETEGRRRGRGCKAEFDGWGGAADPA